MELRIINYLQRMSVRMLTFAVLILLAGSCYYDKEEDLYPGLPGSSCDTTGVTWSGTVVPLMASNCNACHNPAAPSGNVVTSTFDGLKTAVNSGIFWKAINHEAGASPMPQGGNKLPDCDLRKIKAWIDAGAPQN